MAKLQIQSFAKIPNDYVSVERSRGLSILEEKLVYMLINTMQKRWESVKKLEQVDYNYIASGVISFDEFINTMQVGAKDNKLIYQSLKDLFDYSLTVHQSNETRFIHLFGDMIIKHDARQIQYKLGDVFVEYFTGICKDYFRLSVEEVIGLNSTHAIRIYQLLKTKQNMDKKEFDYSIDAIKNHLGIEKKYSLYGHFKSRVLETSKQQINASNASQFNIDYEEIKTGRAVTAIKFCILPKGKNYYQENNLIAGYKIDQLTKLCLKWKKESNETDVVYILADKILVELKNKKPNRNVIANYVDTITTLTKQQKLDL